MAPKLPVRREGGRYGLVDPKTQVLFRWERSRGKCAETGGPRQWLSGQGWEETRAAAEAAERALAEEAQSPKESPQPSPHPLREPRSPGPLEWTIRPLTEGGWSKLPDACLGKGQFGSVWKARDERTGRLFAVKQLLKTSKQQDIEDLMNEARIMRLLNHPNIAQCYGMDEDEESYYLQIELADCSLSSCCRGLVGEPRPLEELRVRRYTRQILLALAHIHKQGIMHRDIKARNIVLHRESDCVKLVDFGAAKMKSDTLDHDCLTNTQGRGTPIYSPPEQINSAKYDLSVDIWALGCTVIELLTGDLPWKDLNTGAAPYIDQNGQLNPQAALIFIGEGRNTPPLPDSLSEKGKGFLTWCLRRKPEKRASADMLLGHPFVMAKDIAADAAAAAAAAAAAGEPGFHSQRQAGYAAVSQAREPLSSPAQPASPQKTAFGGEGVTQGGTSPRKYADGLNSGQNPIPLQLEAGRRSPVREGVTLGPFPSGPEGASSTSNPVSILGPEPVSILGPWPVSILQPEPASILHAEPASVVNPEPVSILNPEPVSLLRPEPVSIPRPMAGAPDAGQGPVFYPQLPVPHFQKGEATLPGREWQERSRNKSLGGHSDLKSADPSGPPLPPGGGPTDTWVLPKRPPSPRARSPGGRPLGMSPGNGSPHVPRRPRSGPLIPVLNKLPKGVPALHSTPSSSLRNLSPRPTASVQSPSSPFGGPSSTTTSTNSSIIADGSAPSGSSERGRRFQRGGGAPPPLDVGFSQGDEDNQSEEGEQAPTGWEKREEREVPGGEDQTWRQGPFPKSANSNTGSSDSNAGSNGGPPSRNMSPISLPRNGSVSSVPDEACIGPPSLPLPPRISQTGRRVSSGSTDLGAAGRGRAWSGGPAGELWASGSSNSSDGIPLTSPLRPASRTSDGTASPPGHWSYLPQHSQHSRHGQHGYRSAHAQYPMHDAAYTAAQPSQNSVEAFLSASRLLAENGASAGSRSPRGIPSPRLARPSPGLRAAAGPALPAISSSPSGSHQEGSLGPPMLSRPVLPKTLAQQRGQSPGRAPYIQAYRDSPGRHGGYGETPAGPGDMAMQSSSRTAWAQEQHAWGASQGPVVRSLWGGVGATSDQLPPSAYSQHRGHGQSVGVGSMSPTRGWSHEEGPLQTGVAGRGSVTAPMELRSRNGEGGVYSGQVSPWRQKQQWHAREGSSDWEASQHGAGQGTGSLVERAGRQVGERWPGSTDQTPSAWGSVLDKVGDEGARYRGASYGNVRELEQGGPAWVPVATTAGGVEHGQLLSGPAANSEGFGLEADSSGSTALSAAGLSLLQFESVKPGPALSCSSPDKLSRPVMGEVVDPLCAIREGREDSGDMERIEMACQGSRRTARGASKPLLSQKSGSEGQWRNTPARASAQPGVLISSESIHFTLEELKVATDNFSEAKVVGKGAFGKVFEGMLRGTPVAIKRMHQHLENVSESGLALEARVLRRVRHPRVVTLMGVYFEEKEMPCVVYEFLPGGDLFTNLTTKGGRFPPLSALDRVRIATEVASALVYLQRHEPSPIFHRDLKPQNILLDEHRHAKVADWGLAMSAPETQKGIFGGTPGYVAPEIAFGNEQSRASDTYSFGRILLDLLLGPDGARNLCKEEKVWGMTPEAIVPSLDPSAGPWLEPWTLELVGLAKECMTRDKAKRPSMVETVFPQLEGIYRSWLRHVNQ